MLTTTIAHNRDALMLVLYQLAGTPCIAGRGLQKRPMGLEIEAPTPDKYEKGAGRLEGGTA